MKLVSNVPGIRSKALELITMVTPKLIEKEDARRVQVIQKFMREHSTDFFTQLTQNFLENGDGKAFLVSTSFGIHDGFMVRIALSGYHLTFSYPHSS